MGTRGLKIVRFRGRYFVYWNQYDSYPDVLGQMLVDQIPTEPMQYKQWLEEERVIYAQMTAELESKVLPVTKEKIITDLKRGTPAVMNMTYNAKSESWRPYQVVDDRLDGFPTGFCRQGIDLWVEWTYTIDLDRELFSVDSWIYFSMNNIPRDRWIKAFSSETGDKIFSFQDCPEGTDEHPKHDYFIDKEASEGYKAKYRGYKCSIIQPKTRIDRSSKTAHGQVIGVVMFAEIISSLYLRSYLPSWSYKDFAFRELSFAILSFAAGQYRFSEPQRLVGEETNGYLMDYTEDRSELLPLFGTGCHSPGKEAGSAPRDTMYWLENVLVNLVPDFVMQDDTEAAIAAVVEFGLEEGKLNFYAVVFSVVNVIMIHVTMEDGVTTINRNQITDISALDDDVYQEGNQLEILCQKRAGFISLIHFFNAAADRYLAPLSQGRFPTEIYSKIAAHIDDDRTYKALAKVSKVFRAICQENIMFGKHLTMIKLNTERHSKRENLILTFLDRDTEDFVEFRLRHKSEQSRGGTHWSPVIGKERPSIITAVELHIETGDAPVSKPRPRYLEGYFSPYSSVACSVRVTWKLPQDATSVQVEEIWAYYLQRFLYSDDRGSNWYTKPCTFTCMLIPHYREFSLTYVKYPLWVCVRRPIDGSTPQQRAKTLTYVTSRFKFKGQARNVFDPVMDGTPVIVAFGLDVTLYYWRKSGDNEGSLEPHLHFDDYSMEEAREEMETKVLRPLVKGWKRKVEEEFGSNGLTQLSALQHSAVDDRY